MNEILSKLLGGAMMAGGATMGSPGLMRAGWNRVGPQGHAVPPSVPGGQPDPSVYGAPTSMPTPMAPPRPPLSYSTGGGSPAPSGFRFPSAGRPAPDEMLMQ